MTLYGYAMSSMSKVIYLSLALRETLKDNGNIILPMGRMALLLKSYNGFSTCCSRLKWSPCDQRHAGRWYMPSFHCWLGPCAYPNLLCCSWWPWRMYVGHFEDSHPLYRMLVGYMTILFIWLRWSQHDLPLCKFFVAIYSQSMSWIYRISCLLFHGLAVVESGFVFGRWRWYDLRGG